MFVFVYVDVRMEYSDDEDFILTQNSNKDYFQTQSAGYGDDVVDCESDGDKIVSLECMDSQQNNDYAVDVFQNVMDGGCDGELNIAIENISDEESGQIV